MKEFWTTTRVVPCVFILRGLEEGSLRSFLPLCLPGHKVRDSLTPEGEKSNVERSRRGNCRQFPWRSIWHTVMSTWAGKEYHGRMKNEKKAQYRHDSVPQAVTVAAIRVRKFTFRPYNAVITVCQSQPLSLYEKGSTRTHSLILQTSDGFNRGLDL